ncbi:MAG: rab guanine nucleotide exchange factor S2 [Sclerophora amabilis]|nr:MAG: rab guanine nucleotide exchange factor S2 [Sclerophora amabilis]
MAAAVASAPSVSMQPRARSESNVLSTLPDPRASSIPPHMSRHVSASREVHPDLNNEVATLSNKLINAINHQTDLDDTLTSTQHELDSSRERIRELEAQTTEHAQMLSSRLLLTRAEVEDETMGIMTKLAEERKQRSEAEREKKKMEQELENLTKELFEQANEMVSAARHERDATQRKNDQLKSQVLDTESLLRSHQDQLAELKSVMQQMGSDRSEENESNANVSTAPTTPSISNQEHLGKIIEALHLSPNSPGSIEVNPSYPTSFTHLLQPVLRTDLQAYDEFHSLLQISKASAPPSRVPSGSYAGLNVMGLGALSNHSQPSPLAHSSSSGSSSSVSSGPAITWSPAAPSTPASSFSGTPTRDVSYALTSLKETRFYKRVLAEDVEPTLRLDTAPGLSWLARRTVLNSMCDGNLIVEPMPPSIRLHLTTCSLCGESRKGEKYSRTHRFKTSESDSAQRYPLCTYCLGRVRSACDFFGFLRMIKDGHWRTEGEESEKGAWEESVRLREQMFWARLGGGVIPAFVSSKDSPRLSDVEERREGQNKVESGIESAPAETTKDGLPQISEEDPFRSDEKRVSIGKRVISTTEGAKSVSPAIAEETVTQPDDQLHDHPDECQAKAPTDTLGSDGEPSGEWDPKIEETGGKHHLPKESDTPQALSPTSSFSAMRGQNRLSINIPGAFE